jgi:hypothetical protein
VRPILEYGAACWDPYREGQIHALDMVQKKADKFAYRMSESNWETLAQRRKIARICAFFKDYVVFVCKSVLPPGDNPIAVNKYITS